MTTNDRQGMLYSEEANPNQDRSRHGRRPNGGFTISRRCSDVTGCPSAGGEEWNVETKDRDRRSTRAFSPSAPTRLRRRRLNSLAATSQWSTREVRLRSNQIFMHSPRPVLDPPLSGVVLNRKRQKERAKALQLRRRADLNVASGSAQPRTGNSRGTSDRADHCDRQSGAA